MIVFTSKFLGMNIFGFQNNPHGHWLALLIILLINVYIYFAICKKLLDDKESSGQED